MTEQLETKVTQAITELTDDTEIKDMQETQSIKVNTPLTAKENIAAGVILENLKKREDNFLDIKNRFNTLIDEFSTHVETIREIPNKSKSMVKEGFNAHTPMLAEAIKASFKRDIKDVVTPLSSAVSDFEEKLEVVSTKVDDLFTEATTEVQKSFSGLVENAKSSVTDMVANATETLNQSIANTQNCLHEVEASLRNVLAETKDEQYKAQNNQWKWIVTVFVSSIAASLLSVWVRMHV